MHDYERKRKIYERNKKRERHNLKAFSTDKPEKLKIEESHLVRNKLILYF